MTREAVEQFLGKDGFPPSDFPVELILAMTAQESGFDNEVNGDGLMQVTAGSGCHRDGLYSNTRQGVCANVEDGLKVLEGFYEYSNKDIIGAIWRYNGGQQPYWTYYYYAQINKNGNWIYGGDAGYLGHVANKYKDNIKYGFGDENSELVKQLRKAQKQVTDTLQSIEREQGLGIGEIHYAIIEEKPLAKIDKNSISIFCGGKEKDSIWLLGD